MKRISVLALHFFLPFWFISFPHFSVADLLVTPAVIDFRNDSPPRQNIEIKNPHNSSSLYIDIRVNQVTDPDTEQQTLTPVTKSHDQILTVTPSRFVLPPQNTRDITFTTMKTPVNTDQVFQIQINATPIQEAGLTEPYKKNAHTVLIILRPEEPLVRLTTKRNNNDLKIHNAGNTSVVLYDGMRCSADTEPDCKPVSSKRLYSDQTWLLPLPRNHTICFEVYDGKQSYRKTFR